MERLMIRAELEDAVKFEVLTNWLVEEIERDYISIENLKKLLKALDVPMNEGNEE